MSPAPSPEIAASQAYNATLARRLLMGLIVFCAAMLLLGPTIADSVLSLLGCQPEHSCGSVANWIGRPFAAFYRSDSLLDVPFIFITNFWPLVLAWLGLIAYVRSRKPPDSGAQGSAAAAWPQPPLAVPERSAMCYWTRPLAQGLLMGLVVFCVLLGTPFLASITARLILSQLGCEAVVLNFGGPQACLDAPGFWTPRLRDYMNPVGTMVAPFLLVQHFHKLLIGWALATAVLFYLASLDAAAAPKQP